MSSSRSFEYEDDFEENNGSPGAGDSSREEELRREQEQEQARRMMVDTQQENDAIEPFEGKEEVEEEPQSLDSQFDKFKMATSLSTTLGSFKKAPTPSPREGAPSTLSPTGSSLSLSTDFSHEFPDSIEVGNPLLELEGFPGQSRVNFRLEGHKGLLPNHFSRMFAHIVPHLAPKPAVKLLVIVPVAIIPFQIGDQQLL